MQPPFIGINYKSRLFCHLLNAKISLKWYEHLLSVKRTELLFLLQDRQAVKYMARLSRAETVTTSGLPLAKILHQPSSFTPGSMVNETSRKEEAKFIQTIKELLAYNVAVVVKGFSTGQNSEFTLEELVRGGRNPKQSVGYQGMCIYKSNKSVFNTFLDTTYRLQDQHRFGLFEDFVQKAKDPKVCWNLLDYPTFVANTPAWLM
jgi:hypothetical protein